MEISYVNQKEFTSILFVFGTFVGTGVRRVFIVVMADDTEETSIVNVALPPHLFPLTFAPQVSESIPSDLHM